MAALEVLVLATVVVDALEVAALEVLAFATVVVDILEVAALEVLPLAASALAVLSPPVLETGSAAFVCEIFDWVEGWTDTCDPFWPCETCDG